ncbi:MAG: Na+/H+ antiporter subunit B [Bacteroidota bacterium]
MESIILQIASRHLKPLLVVLSLVVLYRGHNEPGGGFIGGLLFGSAYILYAMAFGVEKTRNSIIINPIDLTATGLLLAVLSGLPAVIPGEIFMTGQWTTLFAGSVAEIKLGTPLLFDVGVYLSVAGMLMLLMFSIMEE